MAISFEQEGVEVEEFEDFPASGKAELLVELGGVVEAEDLVGLFGEEVPGSGEEAEVRVAVEDVLEVGEEVWLGLDWVGSGALFLLPFLLELFGGFGDEEGGRKLGSEGGGGGGFRTCEEVLGFCSGGGNDPPHGKEDHIRRRAAAASGKMSLELRKRGLQILLILNINPN